MSGTVDLLQIGDDQVMNQGQLHGHDGAHTGQRARKIQGLGGVMTMCARGRGQSCGMDLSVFFFLSM